MGKRKSRAKPQPKKKMGKLDTVFNCPFCNHSLSVQCSMDRKNNIGMVRCGTCEEKFSMKITDLLQPIDVYSEWIDECERANNLEHALVAADDDDDVDRDGYGNVDENDDYYEDDIPPLSSRIRMP